MLSEVKLKQKNVVTSVIYILYVVVLLIIEMQAYNHS